MVSHLNALLGSFKRATTPVHVLASVGHDLSGDLILGGRAYDLHLAARREWERKLIRSVGVPAVYPDLALWALAHGIAGSSAAGEFPKFPSQREIDGEPVSVIVKFSGADDLLQRVAGRTFLEVVRFDRAGPHGRLPLCLLGALNGALLGISGAA